MEYVQGKELTELMECEKNKIKTNIKMRVTPEQFKKICKIIGKEWMYFKSANYMYIYNGAIQVPYTNRAWDIHDFKEIDADLFIRTNGTCEEKVLGEDCLVVSQYNIDMLQETISKQKEEIEFKNEIIKELEDLNRMLKQGGTTKDLSISIVEEQNKEIEKLKAVIEYLESKVK